MQNESDLKKIGSVLLRFVSYGIILLMVAKIIEIDMQDQSVTEGSLVENSQEILVFINAVLVAVIGFKRPQIRVFSYVFSAIAVVSLIREMDAFLENNLFDKAWQTLALIVIVPTLWFVFKNRSKLIDQVYGISNTFSFGLMFAGTIIIHAFARLFGRESAWTTLMTEENYVRAVKDAAEEGVELLGYAIVFMGAIELALLFSASKSEESPIHETEIK